MFRTTLDGNSYFNARTLNHTFKPKTRTVTKQEVDDWKSRNKEVYTSLLEKLENKAKTEIGICLLPLKLQSKHANITADNLIRERLQRPS